ncbi:MAG: hypothetical protein GX558_05475 [Clostridiales bacterium]|nr:hypothetical protein [Clostridiales bacterium]
MRSLASGIPFARNDPALFYRQVKFMEHFSDDHRGDAPFFMYYPCYQHMGYEQLRTYFTWRAAVRRGEFRPTSPSYVFLHIYELLSGVGAEDPADGLAKLLAVWNAYREAERALDNYLPGWLKDYHIYYTLPHGFEDFVNAHGLRGHYLDLFLFDADAADSFALWRGMSSYDVAQSKFYAAGNEALMQDCFSAVLGGIRALCASRNGRIEDLMVCGVRSGVPWSPFGQALFYPWLRQPDRRVELPGREAYLCKDNRWTADMPARDTDRREFAGYLMKKTEACLRQAVGHKFQITANPGAFCNLSSRLSRLRITPAELDAAIEKAVSDFRKNRTRTAVVVDHENLNRIRKDARRTQDRLIVPEDGASAAPLTLPERQYAPPPIEPAAPDFGGWTALKGVLSATELAALSMLLRGGASIKTFADENGVMLEVLADSINEKAADCIGDGILEFADGMAIYEEYREKIAEMVG